jgi:hypothetical protein
VREKEKKKIIKEEKKKTKNILDIHNFQLSHGKAGGKKEKKMWKINFN